MNYIELIIKEHAELKEDCLKIKKAAKKAGYDISTVEAYCFWEHVSALDSSHWLTVPDDEDAICGMLLRHLTKEELDYWPIGD